MFIKDLSGTNIPVYSCSPFIGRWLVKEHSIPVLSIDTKWHFSRTPLLEEILLLVPFYLKVLDIF